MQKNQATFNYRYSSSKEQNAAEFIECVVQRGYGDMITLSECGKILSYNLENEQEYRRFRSLMSRIRLYLIDRGYVLKSVPSVGYYIMQPKQIPSYVYRIYTLRSLRLMERQDRILKHTPTSDLSEQRKQENKEIKELTKRTYEAINKSIDESEYFKNKSIYDNLTD